MKHEAEESSATRTPQHSALDSPLPLKPAPPAAFPSAPTAQRSLWRGEENLGAVPGLLSPSLSSSRALFKNGRRRLLVRRGLPPTPLSGHQQQAY